MDEPEQNQSKSELRWRSSPGVVAVLGRHREEIAEAWVRRGLQTLRPSEPMDSPERKARAVRTLEAMSEAFLTGSYQAVDQIVFASTAFFGAQAMDIGSLILTLLQVQAATLDVLRHTYPTDTDLILDCMVHLDHFVNYFISGYSREYAAEINRRLSQQHAKTQWMLDTARAASSSLDLDEVLTHAAKMICQALGVPDCVIAAIGEKQEQLVFRRTGLVVTSQDELDTGQGTPDGSMDLENLSDGNLQMMEQKRPTVFHDPEHDPGLRGLREFLSGSKSVLGLPFVVNDRVVALAWVRAYYDDCVFGQEEIDLAQGIANVAALAVDNARLYGEADRLARTEERQRMAMELHDTVAQISFSIGLRAHQALEDRTLSETSRAHLSTIERLAARSGFELRSAIFALDHLETGDRSELASLLQELANDFQGRTGIRTTLILPTDLPALPSMICTHIFRIVRESLSNVHKHAQASAALVSLRCDDGSITVSIQDNGVGLPDGLTLEQPADSLHFGLAAMRHIAQEAEGEFAIANNDDGGTLVQVRMQLKREQNS